MNFVSAYLIMQKADADDPLHPKQEKMPKSWFKELFRAHLMDFPQYMGIDFDMTVERLVGRTRTETRQGVLRYDDRYYLTSIDDLPYYPGNWLLAVTDSCYIPTTTIPFQDVSQFVSYKDYGVQTVGCSGKLVAVDGTVSYRSGHISRFPTEAKEVHETDPNYHYDKWLYAVPCKVKLPIFSNVEDGRAYAAAAVEYYISPTSENYETLCNYIDLCDNPDG